MTLDVFLSNPGELDSEVADAGHLHVRHIQHREHHLRRYCHYDQAVHAHAMVADWQSVTLVLRTEYQEDASVLRWSAPFLRAPCAPLLYSSTVF
jgi:hypothetical protein